MKRFIFLFLLIFCKVTANAQSNPVDQEKLMELYQTQRYTDAVAYLQTVYGTDITDVKQLRQLAYANMMAGNLLVAEKNYLKLYETQPTSLPLLFNLASISNRRGDKQKAKFYYQEIIKIDSTNFNVYNQLSSLYPAPDAPEKLFYLKKANVINPAHADVAFDLASGLNMTKKNDSAYLVLKPALAADTNNIMLLKAKLPICIVLKKFDEALLTGEKILSLGDSATNVISNIGRVYFNMKQYEKAIKMYKILEKTDQKNESTLYYTALSYRELKDFPQSELYIKATIKEGISPFTSIYYKTLGEIYEKRVQVKNANQSYNKSLEFDNNGEVYYNLALLNDGPLANKKLAIKYYKQFLMSKPDAEKYKEVLVYVKERLAYLAKV